ncbi:LamG-like jellyroll fold domain-containing protein [Flavobacterium sp.]|uniref:LamG-like jellyroll fold domain-containing protein n=1 Tax=Flavobacterium sp. TaxID=239 RepID=UPI003266D371
MKKILLFTLLLANFFFANAFTRITAYRWRNDNGTETNATWKAATNTPIQINTLDPIRIRIAIEDNSGTDPNNDQFLGSTIAVDATIEFSVNNGQTWKSITVSGSPFDFVSSSVLDGTNTTQQITSGNPSSFVAGLFKSTDQNTPFSLPRKNSSFTEHEFCIKPNVLIDASVIYIFRASSSTIDQVTPALTYCPTVVDPPVANASQNFNSNAKVSDLQAVGTDLKWYTTIFGGTVLDESTTLSTGLYYVSQTLSCESTRTQVKVNIIQGATLNFNGGYIDLPFNMPAIYTKEAWINVRDFSAVNNIISGDDQNGRHAIYIPGGKLSTGHNGAYENLKDPTQLSTNTWYHVAVTYDANGTLTLYKNGDVVGAAANVPAFTGTAVRIGAFDPGQNLFNGTIDDVRIWNKVLTQAEIQEKMNCEFAGPQPGLVAYYKFNQGFEGADNSAVTTLTDSSGNGNDGTFVNFDLSENSSNFIGGSIIQTGNTCTTLSVGDHDLDFSSSLKVYPNPSRSAFFIDSDSIGTVVIFDILGKIIQSQKINSGTNTLDLGSTPNGVYLLKVTNEKNQSKTVKLIKN